MLEDLGGFGIPALEAQACGLPAIATDFSAQREVVAVGWRVPFVTLWDYAQGAMMALPSIEGIKDALHSSYIMSKDPVEKRKAAESAVSHAAKYDADKVYAEHWRPFIEDRQPKERKGLSKAAKRRKARA